MDFGKAFTFVFDDEEWVKKIALGGLLSLIPVIGIFLVIGYGLEVTKRVIKDDAEVLPDWSDFGGFLTRGFMASLVALVYMLPVILVMSCSLAPLLFENVGDTIRTLSYTLIACFGCFSLLYILAAFMVIPAAVANYAATDDIGAAFKLGKLIKMVRENLGTYAMVLLGGIIASMVASLGSIACVIGVLFTSVYSFTINGHLWGQAYNVASQDIPASNEPLPKAS